MSASTGRYRIYPLSKLNISHTHTHKLPTKLFGISCLSFQFRIGFDLILVYLLFCSIWCNIIQFLNTHRSFEVLHVRDEHVRKTYSNKIIRLNLKSSGMRLISYLFTIQWLPKSIWSKVLYAVTHLCVQCCEVLHNWEKFHLKMSWRVMKRFHSSS